MNEDLSKELRDIANYFDCHGDMWIDCYQKEYEAWHEYNTFQWRMKHAFSLIQKEKSGVGVDLGCGAGYGLLRMNNMGLRRVIGVDISDRMLMAARNLLDAHGLADKIDLYKADVQNLQMINSESADVCIALGVIEYLSNDERLLQEINRILKIGGVAIIQMRNHECIRSRTIEKLKSRNIDKIEKSEKFRWLSSFVQKPIYARKHTSNQFTRSARAHGFEIKCEVYSHFYALYPFDLVPRIQNLLVPFDNFLSKKMEKFYRNRLAQYLASTYIAKIRKVRDVG